MIPRTGLQLWWVVGGRRDLRIRLEDYYHAPMLMHPLPTNGSRIESDRCGYEVS